MERIGSTHSDVWTGSKGTRGLEIVQNRATKRGLGANRHM